LTFAVLWWSFFTFLTAESSNLFLTSLSGVLGSLIVIRFLVGLGEAAALPNFNRTVANWLAPSERGLGIGISIGGIGLGSAVTPPFVAWLMVHYGWKTAFFATSGIGIVVATAWYLFSRDHPHQHPWVNREELALIRQTPEEPQTGLSSDHLIFSGLLRLRSVWFLTLSYTMLGYIAYIYLSWFFLYLVNVRQFNILQGSFLAAGPFIAIAVFCPLGGWLTDRLTKKHGRGIGRTGIGAAGMFLTSLLIYSGAVAEGPYTAVLMLSLGAGILYSTVGAYWASTIDFSRKYSGALSGLMNMGANLGGTISPTLTPYIGEKWGWPAALTVAAGIAFLGSLLWFGVRFDGKAGGRDAKT
jgi:ACS family glucarate transporter-like MFS transporter